MGKVRKSLGLEKTPEPWHSSDFSACRGAPCAVRRVPCAVVRHVPCAVHRAWSLQSSHLHWLCSHQPLSAAGSATTGTTPRTQPGQVSSSMGLEEALLAARGVPRIQPGSWAVSRAFHARVTPCRGLLWPGDPWLRAQDWAQERMRCEGEAAPKAFPRLVVQEDNDRPVCEDRAPPPCGP